MGLLDNALPLRFNKTQDMLEQLLNVEISRGGIARIRERLNSALVQPRQEALDLHACRRWVKTIKPASPPAANM